jgi:hypothetical protein
MRVIGPMLILLSTACRGGDSTSASRSKPQGASARAPVVAQSCEDAKRFPQSVPENDVRFLDCDESSKQSGEAFELGPPILHPDIGPSPTDPGWYRSGRCDHRGGAVAEYTVYYDDIDFAIACSKQRCSSGDARGCHDLGELYSSDTLPGVRKNEDQAVSAFTAGCDLGFGRSCSALGHIHRTRGDTVREQRMYAAACDANPPVVPACASLGEQLIAQNRAAEATPYLRRGCRGTSASPSSFAAHREGCGLLAELAAQRGQTASQREYLRLECAYGSGGPAACAQLGQLAFAAGDRRRASAYLQRACDASTRAPRVFPDACKLLDQLKQDTSP